MAAFDYGKTKLTADRLIARFGQTVSIRRQSTMGEAHNPELVDTDHTTTAAVVEYANSEVDGTMIQETDRLAITAVGSLTITPENSDKMVIGGVAYPIMNVRPVNPAGVVVVYEIQVRF